jgi:[citrate (pro-3S)-lyase] ligase
MFDNLDLEIVNLDNKKELQNFKLFLEENDLNFEECSYAIRIVDYKKKIVGTGSIDLSSNIIKGVAIDPEYREGNVFPRIVSHFLDYFSQNGIKHCFVFTKPTSAKSFENLGFKEIERVDPLISVLEYGLDGIEDYKDYLKSKTRVSGDIAGAVIVNCNPFTMGHRYLIETAAKKVDVLYVIVVEEDRSAFPFEVRFRLVQEGTEDIKNVVVVKGDKYVVSSATFPSYFLKSENASTIAEAQAELDVRIFARQLAPTLKVSKRFVGTEDYCTTTEAYNKAMQKVLPEFGIELQVVERKRLPDNLIISASHVRKALKEDNWGLIAKLVPETTLAFLESQEALPIITKLKQSNSRH